MTDINEAKRLILAEWERKRAELDTLISALKREMGMANDAPITESVAGASSSPISTAAIKVEEVVQPGDFFGMTQVGAAKDFLSRLNRRTATLNEIAAALYRGKAINSPLPDSGLKNLSSILSRSDEFISVAKGRWGLKEWYPNRAKKRKAVPDGTAKPADNGNNDAGDAR